MKKIFLYIFILLLFQTTVLGQTDIKVFRIVDDNGYTQIAYEKNGVQHVITGGSSSHVTATNDESKILFLSQNNSLWQLNLYEILSKQTIQLRSSGNNVNPKIFGKYVVWEGQKNGTWQIFLFDGVRIKQLSYGGYPAQDVTINDNLVSFSQKNKEGTWDIYLYDIAKDDLKNVSGKNKGRKPQIYNGTVSWQKNEKNKELSYYTYDTKLKEVYFAKRSTGKTYLNSKLNRIRKTLVEKIKPARPKRTEITVVDIKRELDILVEETKTEDIKVEEIKSDTSDEQKNKSDEKTSIKESTESIEVLQSSGSSL